MVSALDVCFFFKLSLEVGTIAANIYVYTNYEKLTEKHLVGQMSTVSEDTYLYEKPQKLKKAQVRTLNR